MVLPRLLQLLDLEAAAWCMLAHPYTPTPAFSLRSLRQHSLRSLSFNMSPSLPGPESAVQSQQQQITHPQTCLDGILNQQSKPHARLRLRTSPPFLTAWSTLLPLPPAAQPAPPQLQLSAPVGCHQPSHSEQPAVRVRARGD